MIKWDKSQIASYIDELDLFDVQHQTWIKFKLWPRQKELIRTVNDAKKAIILKKRQVGASQAIGADSLIQCMFNWNYSVAILSKTGNQEGGDAKVFLDRIRGMYNSIPSLDSLGEMLDQKEAVSKYMIQLVLAKACNPCIKGRDAGVSMRFMSGSYLLSLPASKGRGMTVSRVVLDEAAFIRPDPSRITLDKVFENVVAAIEKSDGQLILISTANGLDLFAALYNDAVEGKNTFFPFFFSCYDDPTFKPAKREQLMKDFGEQHVDQEYPETPEQAFIASGSPRFDKYAIHWYSNRAIKPRIVGTVEIMNGRDRVVQLANGPLQIYKKRKERGQYIVVADVAEGIRSGDWSVAKVYDRHTLQQVAEYRDHIEHRDFGTVCAILGRIYNNAVVVIESNNHGHSSIGRLIDKEEYPEELIFAHGVLTPEKIDDDYSGKTRYGWRTTTGNRGLIINNQAQMIMDKEIPYFNEGDLKENRTFIRKKGGKVEAEETFFDDRVMVNCIAYYLMTNDLFNQHYQLRKFKKHEICQRCQSFKRDMGQYGYCRKSYRYSHNDQCCTMFKEISMLTPEVEQEKRKYQTGYLPLSRQGKG